MTWLAAAVVLAAVLAPLAPARAAEPLRALPIDTPVWAGDFEAMLERRMVRVAVPYSRTLYFNDKGRERGITADRVRELERHLNRKYAKRLGMRPLTVYVIPTTRDELVSDVVEGTADIAVGNLTITPGRLLRVDFVAAENQKPVAEVVVNSTRAPALASAAALSGRTVHVRPSSSYYASLLALNQRLAAAGRLPVQIVKVADALEDEDLMELVNAGVIGNVIVDDWKAQVWAPLLRGIRVNPAAAVREDARVGWAIRQDSPQLRAELKDFLRVQARQGRSLATHRQIYARRIQQIKDPTRSAEWRRFEQTLALFQKYGRRYGFDPLMLAAQGYQESGLNQSARSPAGAIGIMQVLPSTGAELRVGDIRLAEANVHAGAKYMDHLIEKYFDGAHFDEVNRTLFAFAAYNAGPGRIASMRKEAARRGLDPDQWFNHVELVTAERVGMETTGYVRNIYKYFIAYTLTTELQESARAARAAIAKPARP